MTVIDLHTFKEVQAPPHSVLCLGNFDGVHLGHRALAEEVLRKKDRLLPQYPNLKCGAWFFRRPPLDIITGRTTPLLTDNTQKLELFSSLGLDYAFIGDFDEVGGFSPQKFVSDILKKDCGCIFAVCGYNFKFGSKALGDARLLNELMDGNSSTVNQVMLGDESISSSKIRMLISEGDITKANTLLGRKYSIHGQVLHGKKLGRTIGTPTVNQELALNIATPKRGIYISKTLVDGEWFPSVSNIGIRPSVEDSHKLNCETYILGFDRDVYGKDITVEFHCRLRDEHKFESVEALKNQIIKDIESTEIYFKKEQEA